MARARSAAAWCGQINRGVRPCGGTGAGVPPDMNSTCGDGAGVSRLAFWGTCAYAATSGANARRVAGRKQEICAMRPRRRHHRRRLRASRWPALRWPPAGGRRRRPHRPPSARPCAVPSSGSITVHWRGNGHGHGMSQYGARGAAIEGPDRSQDRRLLLPGHDARHARALTHPGAPVRGDRRHHRLRRYERAGADRLRHAAQDRLPVLPARPVRHRAAPAGPASRARWHSLQERAAGAGRLLVERRTGCRSCSPTARRPAITAGSGAVRDGAGEATINRRLARPVRAGLGAARGADELAGGGGPRAGHRGPVLRRGGARRRPEPAASGTSATRRCARPTAAWRTTPAAGNCSTPTTPTRSTNNANMVLRYHGAPVLAQYSASNGGATVVRRRAVPGGQVRPVRQFGRPATRTCTSRARCRCRRWPATSS